MSRERSGIAKSRTNSSHPAPVLRVQPQSADERSRDSLPVARDSAAREPVPSTWWCDADSTPSHHADSQRHRWYEGLPASRDPVTGSNARQVPGDPHGSRDTDRKRLVRACENPALAADFSAPLSEPSVSVWLFVLPLRVVNCGKSVANSEDVPWILWSALLFVLAIATVVYSAYRRDVAAARAQALSGSRILETRCGPIEYGSLGEGSPVLVLHGTGGGWDQGLASARGLAAHGFRLIAPSRFGYLRTPLPADPSPEAEADTWAGFLDALQIQRLPVIAFSAGAAPAAQLALRHPDRVSALVLIVPGAGGLCSRARDRAAACSLGCCFSIRLPDVGNHASRAPDHAPSCRGAVVAGSLAANRGQSEA